MQSLIELKETIYSEYLSREEEELRFVLKQEDGKVNKFLNFSFTERSKFRVYNQPSRCSRFCSRTCEILSNPMKPFMEFILPKNYETSVKPNYVPFAQWAMVASTFMTTESMFSIQAVLYGVGLSVESPTAYAIAFNWIMKDGLGQLGGMLGATFINNKYDVQPRQWRFIADLLLVVSFGIEIMTPIFPKLFLLLASTANVGKNIGWISASATRAAIHKSFMKEDNLADITGKAGSQTIVASVIGTGAAVGLAPALNKLFGYENIFVDAPLIVIVAMAILAFFHLTTLYRSMQFVETPGLDWHRLIYCAYTGTHLSKKTPSEPGSELRRTEETAVEATTDAELEIAHPVSKFFARVTRDNEGLLPRNVDLEALCTIMNGLSLKLSNFEDPAFVAKIEPIVRLKTLFRNMKPKIKLQTVLDHLGSVIKARDRHSQHEAEEGEVHQINGEDLYLHSRITIKHSPSLKSLSIEQSEQLKAAALENKDSPFFLLVTEKRNKFEIVILFNLESVKNDGLEAAFACIVAAKLIDLNLKSNLALDVDSIRWLSLILAQNHFTEFIETLEDSGWDLSNHFLELNRKRVAFPNAGEFL